MKTLVKMIFGSHLYGTNTLDSDTDYKGVFLPSIEQVYLGKIPKSYNMDTKKGEQKNTANDIDCEIYSLHYFIELACQGQTIALDMLHCPENLIMEKTPIWDKIVENRHKFYTKNLKAFIGYAKRQASKYGIKGSRLNDAKNIIEFLTAFSPSTRLSSIWDKCPTGENINQYFDADCNLRVLEVCGRKIQETVTIEYALNIVEKFYKNYGHRAEQAAKNEGIDWKAVSHAIRAAYQVRELLTSQTITFPLKESAFLRDVKSGNLDYISCVAPKLEELMGEVELLTRVSSLPQTVNRKWWEQFLITTLKEEYNA
jgi:predicted nucleotidyltransferase